MKELTIDLQSLTPHGGVEILSNGDVLDMAVTRAIHDVGYNIIRDKIHSYAQLPGLYRLPFRIDMTVKIDSPEMFILIGEGHVSIGSPWMENRRIEDILEPSGKPKRYDNSVEYGQFAEVSIILDKKAMQILINGDERYYSKKERYMKSREFETRNAEGFPIAITCTKRAELSIKNIRITEYDDAVPITHTIDIVEPTPQPQTTEKPTFQSCTKNLPAVIQHEIQETEQFLKNLKHMKFRRTIEKHGNKITYVCSDYGVSYALYLSGSTMRHSFQWYIITNSTPDKWHRKTNMLEAALEGIRQTYPELADRVFYNLDECIGCRERCLAKTLYRYQSQTKLSCHGHVVFKMNPAEFQDVRDFFARLDEIIKEEVQ